MHVDYMHMWWFYEKNYEFWNIVNNKIKWITGIRLPLTLRVMLLLDFEHGKVIICKELIAHMLTAATLMIAKYWKLE